MGRIANILEAIGNHKYMGRVFQSGEFELALDTIELFAKTENDSFDKFLGRIKRLAELSDSTFRFTPSDIKELEKIYLSFNT